jgi:hypothetical protein
MIAGTNDDDWCSINEAARRLGVTPTAIRNRIKRGTLKTRPNGNHGHLVHVPRPVPVTVTLTPHEPVPLTVPEPVTLTVPDIAEALRDQVTFLKGQLEKAELAVERERDRVSELVADLRKLTERTAEVESRAGAAEAKAEALRQDRDHVLERFEKAQTNHIAELLVLREQMAKAEHDRDRVVAELAAHLALPWWRRLLA